MSNEEANTDNLEPYRIRSRREIIFLLENVRSQRQLVKISANGSADAVLTSILAIEADSDRLWFDAAPTQMQNHRFKSCDHINFETKLDQIRVLFATPKAESDEYEGYPALCVPLPDNVVRIQRREYYRVNIPRSNPVLCTFPPPGTKEKPITQPIMLNMLNISMGGVAVIDEHNVLNDLAGARYENCVLALPGGSLTVTLEIANIAHMKLASGKAVRHIGCRFVNISNAVLSVVQRYIMKLERDQNAKMTGFR